MARKLKYYNGRSYDARGSVCVAAYSRADVRRVFVEAGWPDPGNAEIRDYYSDTWGTDAADLPRGVRGLWEARGCNYPRVYREVYKSDF